MAAGLGFEGEVKGESGAEEEVAQGVAGVDDATFRDWTSDSTSSRLDCCKREGGERF